MPRENEKTEANHDVEKGNEGVEPRNVKSDPDLVIAVGGRNVDVELWNSSLEGMS